MSTTRQPRDWPVLAMTVFLVLACCVSALSALTLIVPGTPLDAIWAAKADQHASLVRHGTLAGLAFLLLAAALAVTAVGWARRLWWGWLLAVVIVASNLFGDAAQAIRHPHASDVLPALLGTLLVVWLLSPGMRHRFHSLRAPVTDAAPVRPTRRRRRPVAH